MALVIVLWIVLGLVAVTLLFGDSMRMEYRASANSVTGVEASHTVEGVRRYVAYVLANMTTAGTVPALDSYKAESVPIGDATFWLIGRSDEDLGAVDTPTFGLVDEASKLNLNTATRAMLELLPNMTPEIAAAIIDWRDTDSDPQPDGAEAEAYVSLDPAYECKNAPFESVEELRWIRGMTLELLYGEDTNRNGILDSNEAGDVGGGVLWRGLADYVTVYSRQPNLRADGSPRIPINDPRSQQVAGLLQQTLGAGRGGEVAAALRRVSSVDSMLEFYVTGGITAQEAAQLEDAITDAGGQYVPGRVNVSTAPREVLLCLPGIGDNYADALVASRKSKTTEELATVAWTIEVLDRPGAVQAGPFITARSYQLGADIVAVGRGGRAVRRAWMVFDTASGSTPVNVYREDWTHFGWPLGQGLRTALDARTESGKAAG